MNKIILNQIQTILNDKNSSDEMKLSGIIVILTGEDKKKYESVINILNK